MKKILLLLLAFVVFHFAKLVVDAGAFKTISNKGMEHCQALPAVNGAEDMDYSPSLNQVFISSDNRPDGPSGTIYAMDPDKREPIRATDFPMHPHGIALGGGNTLFVINHQKEKSTIEKFVWKGNKLEHLETLSDPLLVTPNDLVVVGEDLYISLDHGSRSHFAQTVEHFSRIGKGGLLRWHKGKFEKILGGVGFANGLAQKNGTLFLASTMARSIFLLNLDGKIKSSIFLGSGPDNLAFDAAGNLWVAAHPKMLTLKSHAENFSVPSPTQIFRIKDPLGTPEVEEIFTDDGHRISAASIALPVRQHIFLGTIFTSLLMDCAD